MDVPARPPEIKKKLTRLFLAIQQSDLAEARLLLSNLRQEIGRDPDLVKADVLIRRKEVLSE